MSVSSRSPTIRGRWASVRIIDSRCSGGSGFPATTGVTPVADTITFSIDPFPGSSPRSVGIVLSWLAATNHAPPRTARVPSLSRP